MILRSLLDNAFQHFKFMTTTTTTTTSSPTTTPECVMSDGSIASKFENILSLEDRKSLYALFYYSAKECNMDVHTLNSTLFNDVHTKMSTVIMELTMNQNCVTCVFQDVFPNCFTTGGITIEAVFPLTEIITNDHGKRMNASSIRAPIHITPTLGYETTFRYLKPFLNLNTILFNVDPSVSWYMIEIHDLKMKIQMHEFIPHLFSGAKLSEQVILSEFNIVLDSFESTYAWSIHRLNYSVEFYGFMKIGASHAIPICMKTSTLNLERVELALNEPTVQIAVDRNDVLTHFESMLGKGALSFKQWLSSVVKFSDSVVDNDQEESLALLKSCSLTYKDYSNSTSSHKKSGFMITDLILELGRDYTIEMSHFHVQSLTIHIHKTYCSYKKRHSWQFYVIGTSTNYSIHNMTKLTFNHLDSSVVHLRFETLENTKPHNIDQLQQVFEINHDDYYLTIPQVVREHLAIFPYNLVANIKLVKQKEDEYTYSNTRKMELKYCHYDHNLPDQLTMSNSLLNHYAIPANEFISILPVSIIFNLNWDHSSDQCQLSVCEYILRVVYREIERVDPHQRFILLAHSGYGAMPYKVDLKLSHPRLFPLSSLLLHHHLKCDPAVISEYLTPDVPSEALVQGDAHLSLHDVSLDLKTSRMTAIGTTFDRNNHPVHFEVCLSRKNIYYTQPRLRINNHNINLCDSHFYISNPFVYQHFNDIDFLFQNVVVVESDQSQSMEASLQVQV